MRLRGTALYSALVATCLFAVGRSAQGEDASKPSPTVDVAGAKHLTTIEGISEYQLENGLQVLLLPDASKPSDTVNMTGLVGSRNEGYGEAGMAHLLRHMVFKGTPNHPSVPKALRDHGANFNGTTNDDRTNYFETMPA